MKILYTLNSGAPGGMEKHVLDLVRGMVKLNHEVFVWCKEGKVTDWYEKAGAEVTVKNIGFDIDPFYISDLKKFLHEKRIDVVHSHELKAVVNSLIAANFAKTPVKVTHTHTPISTWKVNAFLKKVNVLVNSFFVNNFSNIEIALTESRKRIKISEGIKLNKLKVIPNGLDLKLFDVPRGEKLNNKAEIRDKYCIPNEAFVFGNVSRLSREKGHEILVEAFASFLVNLGHEAENIYLLIAGGGELEDKIRGIVREKKLEKKAIITGIFDFADLHKFYHSFDIFVFPSITEGFGYVLVEAMSSGVPVLSANLEVLQEVGGDTVSYFESGKPEDLKEKMFKMYEDVKSQESTDSGNAVNRVRSLYSLDKFVETYESLYKELLGR